MAVALVIALFSTIGTSVKTANAAAGYKLIGYYAYGLPMGEPTT